MRPLVKKLLRALGVIAALLVALVTGAWLYLRHPAPSTVAGDADALARRMLAAVDADAWARTGAVRWTFFNGDRHLWDRTRSLDRFEQRDLRVLIDLDTRRGAAWRGSRALSGAELDAALDTAWRRWINDSFWLNPVVKAFDEGVARSVARVDGRDALLLQYRSGGVTPGDRYLWLLDENGLPRAWRMWVSIIPIGGLEASWEGWTRLSTGALVATRHQMGPKRMEIRDVAGAETLSALVPGADPFAALTR
ncbi:MAG: hypothetical protein EPO40_31060 [Myxococcaceae bacterium]|nr:MAG: hypothetical protein EPO40_31060 [Myxococcaceae bacterium]